MNTTSIFSDRWINIIFDGRNKAYGAYELRRIADRTLIFATTFTSAIVAVGAIVSLRNGIDSQPPIERHIPFIFDTLQAPPAIEGSKKPEGREAHPQRPRVQDEHKFEIVDTVAENVDTVESPPVDTSGTENSNGEGAASSGGVIPDENAGGTDTSSFMTSPPTLVDWSGVMPEFPGGNHAFKKFMERTLVYPPVAKRLGIEGTVYVSFVVERDGSITDVKVIWSVHNLLDNEAMRVMKLMPNWKPGMQNGKPVRVRYKLPINFTLE
ncbi:MAG TPA: TonB family protein [Chitinophagales bacterium]|nr:TonB family protein [Chitinophagales bacterium]